MNLILEYTSDEEQEQADKRAFKNLLASFAVDDKQKEDFPYMSSKQDKHILNRRNRLSDTLCLSEAGSKENSYLTCYFSKKNVQQSSMVLILMSTYAGASIAPA
ncbi:hypothetical protein DPMN_094800 [Dreissena polymorpha]|uniref:Uncharacterized protein n=1 Tax=Dreissena polymorpha TaxID=45954 RepID=A0A9D4L895_DREPO|nr:hypothetical protein DPMN_094800 [Dreissena polymorpha]